MSATEPRWIRNGLSALADQAAGPIINVIVQPVIVSSIGISGLGVWIIVSRLWTVLALIIGSVGEAVKWRIAKQANRDSSAVDRFANAGLVAWLWSLPIMIFGGTLCAWIVRTRSLGLADDILWIVSLLLTLSVIAAGLHAVFDGVVRGLGLDYLRMGQRFFAAILSALLTCFGLWLGFRLFSIAFGGLVSSVVLLRTAQVIVGRRVNRVFRFPAESTCLKEVIKDSLVISAWSGLWGFVLVSDVLVYSSVVDEGSVGKYSVVKTIPQLGPLVGLAIFSSALPSVVSLIDRSSDGGASIRRIIMDLGRASSLLIIALSSPLSVWYSIRVMGISMDSDWLMAAVVGLVCYQGVGMGMDAAYLGGNLRYGVRFLCGLVWFIGTLCVIPLSRVFLDPLGCLLLIAAARLVSSFCVSLFVAIAMKEKSSRTIEEVRWIGVSFAVLCVSSYFSVVCFEQFIDFHLIRAVVLYMASMSFCFLVLLGGVASETRSVVFCRFVSQIRRFGPR